MTVELSIVQLLVLRSAILSTVKPCIEVLDAIVARI